MYNLWSVFIFYSNGFDALVYQTVFTLLPLCAGIDVFLQDSIHNRLFMAEAAYLSLWITFCYFCTVNDDLRAGKLLTKKRQNLFQFEVRLFSPFVFVILIPYFPWYLLKNINLICKLNNIIYITLNIIIIMSCTNSDSRPNQPYFGNW